MADTIPAPTNDCLLDEANAMKALGNIGRTTFYELLSGKSEEKGYLRSVKIGRRRMVPQSEIDRYIATRVS